MSKFVKHIVPVILVLVLSFSCLVSPAAAATPSTSFNLLNYATANDSGSNYISFSNSTVISYDMPYSTALRYVDMLVTFNGPVPTSVSVGPNNSTQFPLTLEKISSRLYRVYGSMTSKIYHDFYISFVTNSSETSYISIHEINVNPLSTNVIPTVCLLSVQSLGVTNSQSMSDPDSSVEIPFSSVDNDSYSARWMSYIYFTDWTRFDSIDVLFYVDAESITSLNVRHGDLFLPHTVSYINDNTSDSLLRYYWVSVHVDLSSCDRDSTSYPLISMTGEYNPYYTSKVLVKSVSGIVSLDPPSELLVFWYNLRSFLTDRFSSLSSWISNQTTAINSRLSQFDSNVSSYISDQTEEISSVLADFKQEFISQTVALKENLGHKLDNIRGEILAFKGTFDEWMVSFQALIREIFGFDDTTAEDAQQTQEDVNVSINNQLVGAVEDWNANIEVVETGYGLAVTKATPALHWLGTLADRIFVNMGWFASIYFLIGLVSVLMLILSKSGLSRSIGAAARRK